MEDIIPEPSSEHRELSIFEKGNPNSVINLVSALVAERLLKCFETEPGVFEMDESDLYKFLRNNKRTPSPTDNRIRLQFWLEYEKAILECRRMKSINVCVPVVMFVPNVCMM